VKEDLVYIIILNWNGWQDTIECLESVFRNNYSNYKVIVCDNDSHDGSLDKIKNWAEGKIQTSISSNIRSSKCTYSFVNKPIAYIEYTREQAEIGKLCDEESSLILIQTDANLGYAGGNNVGLRYALRKEFDYIWLLNNDTVIEENSLVYLIDKMKINSSIGMCGSTVFYYDEPNTVQAFGGATYNKFTGIPKLYNKSDGINFPKEDMVEKKIYYILGASMLVSKKFLRDIGLISEDYFLYHEEIDWITRAKGRYKIAYASKSIIYHKEGGSTGSNHNMRKSSFLSDYHMIKNRLIFTKKFFPYLLPTVYLCLLVTLFNRMRRGQWDRVKMVIKIMLFQA